MFRQNCPSKHLISGPPAPVIVITQCILSGSKVLETWHYIPISFSSLVKQVDCNTKSSRKYDNSKTVFMGTNFFNNYLELPGQTWIFVITNLSLFFDLKQLRNIPSSFLKISNHKNRFTFAIFWTVLRHKREDVKIDIVCSVGRKYYANFQ